VAAAKTRWLGTAGADPPLIVPIADLVDSSRAHGFGQDVRHLLGSWRSGDAAQIAGYLGSSNVFDRAIASFAERYADQNERDHAALLDAIATGRVHAEPEP
jgi:hypothetical protein